MGETKSAGCSAAVEQDHVPPVGGSGRDKVSGLFCSYRARSRTHCGREMGETQSAGCCAAIEQDHVLSVGREMGETKSAGCSAAIEQDHVLSVGG
jgi:hypothetical protein